MLTAAVSCSNIKLRHHHHDHHASTLWDTSEDSDTKTNYNKNKLFDELPPPDETSSSSEFDLNVNVNDDFEKFHKSHKNNQDNDRDEISTKSGKNCKTCQNGVKMTEEELTALRIEFVKNQILKKLRLTERPNVSIKDLPRPITEKLVPFPDTENVNQQLEDYYGKTTKKFIFLQEGNFLFKKKMMKKFI